LRIRSANPASRRCACIERFCIRLVFTERPRGAIGARRRRALIEAFSGTLRVFAVGLFAYAALVLLLRLAGKRTLTKLNAFDLIVTVALGSTLATVLLSQDVSPAEGAAALALLVAMQFAVAWTSVRSSVVARLVKAEPTLLLHDGRMLDAAMRRERVTRAEVLAALRGAGLGSPEQAEAVVLETDGSLSVIAEVGRAVAMAPVRGWPPGEAAPSAGER
jgi:uncharacterized membrane protein YcaP (DUF421 family)